jgi:hypothetical protein
MEFSKSDKQTIRAIIKKGLMVECERGLHRADQILNGWKQNKSNPHEAYLDLYEHITKFDKGIARRYDDIRNSNLTFILGQQLQERLVNEQELDALSEEGREAFLQWFNSIVGS